LTVIDLKKSDFFLGGRFKGQRKRKRDPYGVHMNREVTYQYRSPIGYNEDGSLAYGWVRNEVKGRDWTYPAPIWRNTKDDEYHEMPTDERIMAATMKPKDSTKDWVDDWLQNKVEPAAIREIGDTASHEAGHSAHDIADPRRRNHEWDEMQANKERGGYGLFDEKNESSADEHVAYTTEYPHKRGRWGGDNERKYHEGMEGHPDVSSRYGKKLGEPLKATHSGGYQRDPRRNLRNAVLDMAASIGKRTGAGNFQFGDIDSAANRKKQAEREIRPLLQQIEKLTLPNAQSFSDLPQELQEGIGGLRTREMLSRWMEENHESSSQQELMVGSDGGSAAGLFAENPQKFLENYETGDIDYDYDHRGRFKLGSSADAVIPDWMPIWGEKPELLDLLEENFGNPDYNQGWGVKAKVKSNPYRRSPKKYYDPRFGPEAILDDIKDAFATAEENEGVEFDSSRAFMKSWGLLKSMGQCDSCGEETQIGKLRLSDTEYSSVLHLCRGCWANEMEWRQAKNEEFEYQMQPDVKPEIPDELNDHGAVADMIEHLAPFFKPTEESKFPIIPFPDMEGDE
jgi:hypothetical protein